MELFVKTSHWATGIPVAMLNEKTAKNLGIHPGDRILISTFSKNQKKFSTIVDLVKTSLKEDQIAISSEIKKTLNLKDKQKVQIGISENPESVNYIKEKMNGKKLSKEKIFSIIKDVVNNSLSEPEVAAFVSGMHTKGMNFKETVNLIEAILSFGKTMKINKKYVVDKHSIGGIAGNRTTPIVVSICAAAGLTFPKNSSRAITSAAGTADCIEVLSKVEFSMKEVKRIIDKTGACLVWGGSLGMVPADSKIIKVEKMLKIDPISQLLASIMSKKLSVGSKYVLIDIPFGKGAKVNKVKGIFLKNKFEKLAKHFGIKMKVVLTKSKGPIGKGVGPALEMMDVLKVLNPRENGPKDLEKKSLFLAGELFEMVGKTKKGEGKLLAHQVLTSGKAYEKFKQIIKAQEGTILNLIPSKIKKNILSKKSGKIKSIDNKKINYLARVAGCPLDKFAGVYLHKKINEKVKKGEKILTIYAESSPRLKEAIDYYDENKIISF